MSTIILGIIREGKTPPDKRVPLTPRQCVELQKRFPHVKVLVQPSEIRAIQDSEYADAGVELNADMTQCDILIGVKEVPIPELIQDKTYLFFSHTFKKQPYNRDLLRAILAKRIRLIDYEVLKDIDGQRLIGFGRWAGIVGVYNSFLTYGLKTNSFELKPAHLCFDRKEMEAELSKVKLDNNFKLVLTGWGRVGLGAREVLKLMPLREVSPEDFLSMVFSEPVFTQLEVGDYNALPDGSPFVKEDFYKDASAYISTFPRYLSASDMYIACHYYSNDAPFLASRADFKIPNLRLKVVGDVSADIDGPVGCTLRASKISDPIYGYDPQTESEVDFRRDGAIAVMAIDNLPCELPRDASEDFGNMLLDNVFPYLFGNEDVTGVIERATQTDLNGHLTPKYAYLSDYVNGEKTTI
jgi:alanine dehydrogenase